ncbi:hypothetical protein E3P99_03316 [Wallemia hederae]|uniref:DNA replication regulator SLD2 n=1 Tax=Wallemia hederae TaxID=1540922 RepID=A0A4T0FFZ4_9BASI|nr:hypothetical protein E3P99_03316 [Wallemia hederae]
MDAVLRNELKAWEKNFLAEHNRKPGKDDIKKLPDVAEKYKAYSRLKKGDGKDGAVQPQPALPATTPKKNTASVFKTPSKNKDAFASPRKEPRDVHAYSSPHKLKQMINTLSPNTTAKGWTPRTKARKRLRGENVPNTPKKQRTQRTDIASIEEEHDIDNKSDKQDHDDEDDDMMNTPAKNKAFKPIFDSPRASTSTGSHTGHKGVILPPLPTNTVSTYIDNPQSQEIISSQATIPQSQSQSQSQSQTQSQTETQTETQAQPQPATQRGQKRRQSPDNAKKATLAKKKSKTTLKYPNRVELPQSQSLTNKQHIHNQPSQLELESTGQQISIIPHTHTKKKDKKTAVEGENAGSDDNLTDLEDDIPMAAHRHTQGITHSPSPPSSPDKIKSKLGDLNLDSPGAVKRTSDYNKHIDDKVRSLLSRGGGEDGFGNYRTEIKPLDEQDSDGDDDDWEEDCDGWKADGVGFMDDYDYDEI